MPAALAERRVTPELLDHLPVDDPAARGSRRDLVRINRLMFQPGIMARLLKRCVATPPRRILELGCGDGSFMLAVARRVSGAWPEVELVLLDQASVVPREHLGAFGALGWRATTVTADAIGWMEAPGAPRFDLVTANLFLHHFADDELRRLLVAASGLAPLFAATEPRRSAPAYWGSRLLRLVGANALTMHDAGASVRAGFRKGELAGLWAGLGPVLCDEAAGLFTEAFCAAGERS